jgi:hypothetical protein
LFQEFAQQERLFAQRLSTGVVGEEVREFVTEDGYAGRFQSDYGDAGFNFGLELVEDFEQKAFRAVQHSEVIEGTSAAEVRLGDQDAKAGGFQDLDGSAGGLGEEVVVEGVGPKENLWG